MSDEVAEFRVELAETIEWLAGHPSLPDLAAMSDASMALMNLRHLERRLNPEEN